LNILDKLKTRARANRQRIVLPEGEDPRVIAAAGQIMAQGCASLTLVGRETAMRETAARAGVSLDGAKLVDPAGSVALANYARILHERRRSHGMTLDEATQTTRRPLYFAALAVAAGDADGSVGGAANTTAETVRAARRTLRVIHQNLAWAAAYNAVALPLAMAGLVTPLLAAAGMSASSLLVVLNALRLQKPAR